MADFRHSSRFIPVHPGNWDGKNLSIPPFLPVIPFIPAGQHTYAPARVTLLFFYRDKWDKWEEWPLSAGQFHPVAIPERVQPGWNNTDSARCPT